MGFFKKGSVDDRSIVSVNYNKVENNLDNNFNSQKSGGFNVTTGSKKNLVLFNVNDMEYVINNFPEMAIKIKESLNALNETLENTIDFIEDSSSQIIKNDRNFELSQAYRDTSIAIYDVVNNIKDYTSWMKDVHDDNKEKIKIKKEHPKEDTKTSVVDKELINEIDKNYSNEYNIFDDLTLIEPKGFKLKGNMVGVENWDDLLVKTAEILN